jgi:RNA recognition motif-containing protein
MNIYVSNLGFHVSEAEVKDLFAAYGTVASAKLICDKFTGDSRGFAFVEMPVDEEGQNAIQLLNSKEWEGRSLVVNVAKPREGNKSQFARTRSPWSN